MKAGKAHNCLLMCSNRNNDVVEHQSCTFGKLVACTQAECLCQYHLHRFRDKNHTAGAHQQAVAIVIGYYVKCPDTPTKFCRNGPKASFICICLFMGRFSVSHRNQTAFKHPCPSWIRSSEGSIALVVVISVLCLEAISSLPARVVGSQPPSMSRSPFKLSQDWGRWRRTLLSVSTLTAFLIIKAVL